MSGKLINDKNKCFKDLSELEALIPKKTSDLTNDSDFTTKAYVDEKTNETNAYVNEKIGEINTLLDTINGEVV